MLTVSITSGLGAFTLQADMSAGAGLTVLYGRSGCGKTSLVNAVAGLLRPDAGQITLADRVLLDTAAGVFVPPHKRRIGYVFQDARLFPHLSVAANLDYGARFAPAPPDKAARDRLIEVLGIGALLTRRPGALSGGERQRVAFGRALMTAPRLLLLDEPLAALDAARKEEILPYLERLRAEGGPPMLYVSHDMREIVRLADDLVLMKNGRCVAQGRAEDVLSDPANVPLVGVQDAGALLRGRVLDHSADGLTRIQLSAGILTVPKLTAAPGTMLRMRLRAQDVILSVIEPTGLSSQNAVPAVITQIKKGSGPGVAVALEAGGDRLLARITARAQADLGLHIGQQVWAIVKASAVPPGAIAAKDS